MSYRGTEETSALSLAKELRELGFEVWIDIENLRPGDLWQEEIETAIGRAHIFVIYIGPSGVSGWIDRELRIALSRSVDDPEFLVVPLLGPGASIEALPPFLAQHQAIDLSRDSVSSLTILASTKKTSQEPSQEPSPLLVSDAPYRGLFPFDIEHAHLFFGREPEIEALLDKLGEDNFLSLVGDSGSGKSSLVRSGLIPALNKGRLNKGSGTDSEWRSAILHPDDDPIRELAAALPSLSTGTTERGQRELVQSMESSLRRHQENPIGSCISSIMPKGFRALLIVDQFEEIFTRTKSTDQRYRFVDMLLAAANSSDIHVHVLVILRADFYYSTWEIDGLPERLSENQFVLRNIPQHRLREVIQKPLSFTPAVLEAGLLESLVGDITDEPGGLPFLSHLLLCLWEHREGQMLTHKKYIEIGRVSGAIEFHAEKVYARLLEKERSIVRSLFRALVQSGRDGTYTRKRALKSQLLEIDDATEQVIERLIEGRLIRSSQDPSEEVPVLEIAHESLVTGWARLRKWLDSDREFMIWKGRLAGRVDEWLSVTPRDEGVLLRGLQLEEARRWVESGRGHDLDRNERDFTLQSIELSRRLARREHEQLRRNITLLSIALILSLAVVVLIGLGKRRAEALLVQNYKISATKARVEKDWLKASHLWARSGSLSSAGSGRTPSEIGLRHSLGSIALQEMVHHAGLKGVQFSNNKTMFLTWAESGAPRLWKADSGSRIELAPPPVKEVIAAQFSRDDSQVVMWSPTEIYLCSIRGSSPRGCEALSLSIKGPAGVAMSPGSDVIVSWDAQGAVQLWRHGQEMDFYRQHDSEIKGVMFADDGDNVITFGDDGVVREYEVEGKPPLIQAMETGTPTNGVVFNKAETLLVSYGGMWNLLTPEEEIEPIPIEIEGQGDLPRDESKTPAITSLDFKNSGRIHVWERPSGDLKFPAMAHSNAVLGVDLSSDETRLLTWCDNEVRVWSMANGAPLMPPRDHLGVRRAEFSNSGQLVLSWSDTSVAVWDANTGDLLAHQLNHDRVWGAKFNPTETAVLSWGADGQARLWSLQGSEVALPHRDMVRGAEYINQGNQILTWSADGSARLWSSLGGEPVSFSLRHRSGVLDAMAIEDEGLILTFSEDGEVKIWRGHPSLGRSSALEHDYWVKGATFLGSHKSNFVTWGSSSARIWLMGSDKASSVDLDHSHFNFGEPQSEPILGGTTQQAPGSRFVAISLDPPRPELKVTVNPEGDRAITSGENGAQLWDLNSHLPKIPPLKHEHIEGAQLSHDERWILTWSRNGTARVWRASDGSNVSVLGHKKAIWGARFSSDGAKILTWSEDGSARTWATYSGIPQVPPLVHHGKVTGAEFLRKESRVLTRGLDWQARLWNASTGEEIGSRKVHYAHTAPAVSKDESMIFTFYGPRGDLSRTEDGSRIPIEIQHQDRIAGATFSSDSRHLCTWGYGGLTRLWDLEDPSAQPVDMFHGNGARGAHFLSNGGGLMTWGSDAAFGNSGSIRLWDINGNATLPPLAHSKAVEHAEIINGDIILSWDGSLNLWSLADGLLLASMPRSHQEGSSLVLSPDKKIALSWGSGNAFLHRVGAYFENDEFETLVEAQTGTRMDQLGNISVLTAEARRKTSASR